ncbi:MAG TPA: tetratricopeptide repeat protein [Terriglobia bacterium]|nr:tetratricopeptide repeat protein [Terriglobia bacterium]
MNRRLMIWTLVTLGIVAVVVYEGNRAKSRAESAVNAEDAQGWPEIAAPSRTSAPPDGESGGEHELKALESSLRKNPDHVPILLRMAQVAHDMGKPTDALQHLQEAVKLDPKNVDVKLELGRLLYETGDVAGAARETEELLEIDPSNLDALYNLGAIYGNLGQDDLARKYWRKAVAISPDSESGQRSQEALKQIGGVR